MNPNSFLQLPAFKKPLFWWGLISLFSVFFLLSGIHNVQLIDWDENIYGEAARQMVLSGNYLNILINDQLFGEKPPFFLWEIALSYKIFGINEFAARFPSCVAAMLTLFLCFYIGAKVDTWQTGCIWGTVYLTSLLPSILAKSAIIDHTFNFFIFSGVAFLYLYDVAHASHKKQKQDTAFYGKHLIYLTLAAVSMGLGVLTKGPLGGAIPIFCFTIYKIFYARNGVRISHFLYCAVLSLSIASSWYSINYFVYGGEVVRKFIEFQLMELNKPLEGHGGPFYYHGVILLIGLFPWTPFLFGKKKAETECHLKPLWIIGCSWVGGVLAIFSLVTTKLPHHSSSAYIPLSFLVAVCLNRYIKGNTAPSPWLQRVYAGSVIVFSGLLLAIPFFFQKYAVEESVQFSHFWSGSAFYMPLVFLLFGGMANIWFYKKKVVSAIVCITIAMLMLTQSLWKIYLPPYLKYIQAPIVHTVQSVQKKGHDVVLYRLVSFAALFYGNKPVEMLHTYKFKGDPKILNQRHDRDLYVISSLSNNERLLKEHPLVEHLRDDGNFGIFILRRRPQP